MKFDWMVLKNTNKRVEGHRTNAEKAVIILKIISGKYRMFRPICDESFNNCYNVNNTLAILSPVGLLTGLMTWIMSLITMSILSTVKTEYVGSPLFKGPTGRTSDGHDSIYVKIILSYSNRIISCLSRVLFDFLLGSFLSHISSQQILINACIPTIISCNKRKDNGIPGTILKIQEIIPSYSVIPGNLAVELLTPNKRSSTRIMVMNRVYTVKYRFVQNPSRYLQVVEKAKMTITNWKCPKSQIDVFSNDLMSKACELSISGSILKLKNKVTDNKDNFQPLLTHLQVKTQY